MQDYNKILKDAQAAKNPDAYGLAIRGASAAMGPAEKERVAAPAADRWAQIGAYTSPAARQSSALETHTVAISKWTEQSARVLDEINRKTPQEKPASTF